MGLDTATFDKPLDRSKAKLRQFDADTRKMAGGVSGLGRELGVGLGPVGTVLDKIGAAGLVAGVGVGAAAAAFHEMGAALRFADDLDATATKIGITAEQFQELTYAAHENDITTEQLAGSLQGLNVALGAYKAGVGDAKVKKVFEELGFTPESLAGVHNAADFMPILADRISKIQDVAKRVKLTTALGAGDLEPLLRKDRAEIERLTARARDLGLVMSNELTTKAADANRELEVMGEYIKAHLTIAFAELGVGITSTAKPMLDLLANLQEINRRAPIAAAKLKTIFTAAEWFARAAGRPETAAILKAAGGSVTPEGGDRAYRGPAMTAAGLKAALKPKAPDTPDAPGGGGGGGGSSRSHGTAKPRFNGPLPDNVKKAIAAGRVTEETMRTEYPDGVFPMSLAIPEELVYADVANGYDATKPEPINVRPVDQNPDLGNPATAAIDATKAANQEAFRSLFTGGLLAALHDGKDGVREWMRQGAEKGLEQALNNLADLLFKLFADSMGGVGSGSGGGGGFGSTVGAVLGTIFGNGSSPVPHFATGGSFTVGGTGGTDSQLMQFRATPGEMVNIKHGNDNGPGGGGGAVTFDLRGAVMTQDLLNQMNQISAQRAGQVYGQIKGEQAQAAKAQRYRVAR
jgi:hypothetical protein